MNWAQAGYRLASGSGDGDGAAMETKIRFVSASTVGFVDRRRKVWLECNGEPYDFRAVQPLESNPSGQDSGLIAFVCPRCGKTHESLVFG